MSARQQILLGLGRFGNDTFTKSLVHMDGANASTTFIDNALGVSSPGAWTAGGGAKVSTASFEFGGASLLLNGTTDYITTPNSTNFNAIGSNPFVVDAWINTTNSGSRMEVAAVANSSGTLGTVSFLLERWTTNAISFQVVNSSGTAFQSLTSGTVSTAGWHHVAGIFDGSKVYAALDGTVTAGTSFTGTVNPTSNGLSVGRLGDASAFFFAGNIDEFRLSIGTTRGWTTNFTPWTFPYV